MAETTNSDGERAGETVQWEALAGHQGLLNYFASSPATAFGRQHDGHNAGHEGAVSGAVCGEGGVTRRKRREYKKSVNRSVGRRANAFDTQTLRLCLS